MSRSHRKTAITGITTAESDKAFKTAEHRRERRAVNSAIVHSDQLPDARQFGNPSASEKDGKAVFDPAKFPQLLRK